MILEKFKNQYSYNFLSVSGWLIFVLLCIYTLPELYIAYIVGNTAHAWGVGITFLGILGLSVLFYLITFFICVFENLSHKRITNEKILNTKSIKIFQNSGIFFAFLPIIIFILFFIYSL